MVKSKTVDIMISENLKVSFLVNSILLERPTAQINDHRLAVTYNEARDILKILKEKLGEE